MYEILWEEHLNYEFNNRNVNKTMETMTTHPYVNHIPTMIGGNGISDLYK